jgi:hypothetical protein
MVFLLDYTLKSERIGFNRLAGQFAEFRLQKYLIHPQDITSSEFGQSNSQE